jgi:hypothetical protein
VPLPEILPDRTRGNAFAPKGNARSRHRAARRMNMVAQASTEKPARAILTPTPDPTDSDDVAIALETARALEVQGETGEAARWLRRAADQAEQDGNDQRVVVLARAAADLASPISGSMPRSIQPPAPKPAPWSVPVSSRPGTPPPPPPARPSAPPLLAGLRVAVERSATDPRLFLVRQLEPHERPSARTVEARLVFTGPEPK